MPAVKKIMGKKNLPKLCITSPWNYPLFNPGNQTHFGGWEVRVALIARELAKRGRFQVNIIVGDHGQPHIEKRDGVTLYSWVGRAIWGIVPPVKKEGRLPATRNSFSRLARRLGSPMANRSKIFSEGSEPSGQVGPYLIMPEMISVYNEVDADIYMVPGNSQFSGEVAFYTRQHGRKYAFLAGSDMDFYPEYKLHPDRLDIYSVPFALKTYAIENADVHFVQNERQAEMLRTGYGRDGIIVKNPIDLTLQFPPNPAAHTVLWVGKSDERVKRPSLVLELARQLPEYSFVLIMNVSVPETHAQCLEAARKLPNVTLMERVPFEQIEGYFANARLHLNTSAFEGFPNTFLQAAKYGVPTISMLVDPGGMLSQHGSGLACGDNFEKLKENIRLLMVDNALYDSLGRKAQDYVREHHEKEMIIGKYEQVLSAILSG